MKRRIIAVLLVLCLCAGLVPTVFAGSTLESSVDLEQLVAHGTAMIRKLEANDQYDSVVNIAGTVGMGIGGWINSAALQLLKWICDADPAFSRQTLGEALYTEVVCAPVAIPSTKMPPWGYWNGRSFSASEIAATKALLRSPVGVQCQNDLLRSYLLTEAQHGWNAGVRTESALIYYCSAEHHYGEYGVRTFMSYVRAAMGITEYDTINSLDELHQGVVAAAAQYSYVNDSLAYRIKTYNYLTQTLGLPSGPDPDNNGGGDNGGGDNGGGDNGGGGNGGEGSNPDPNSPVPFQDMPAQGHWAYDAIVWAYTHDPQITSGTSATTFSPNVTVTRAEAMTFLWAAAGKPRPSTSENPFVDVEQNAYYYTPVLWAMENRITAGTSANTFSPGDTVTLAQMITFIWAFAGRPSPESRENPFSDLSAGDYYYNPVLWAHHGGILVGNENSGTKLLPHTGCSRSYVVTYLYNYFINAVP